MNRYLNLLVFYLFLLSISIYPERLQYKYLKGEKYRIIHEVDEYININGIPTNRTKIMNKIAVHTINTKSDSGELDCIYQTSENFLGNKSSFQLKEDYQSKFWRDRLGLYTIDDKYFMPVIRNIPLFPDKDINIGETWTSDAYEVHDMKKQFGLEQPLRIPIKVHYKYLNNLTIDSKKIAVLKVSYTIFYKTPYKQLNLMPIPVLISGYSEQVYYWNIEEGRLDSHKEEFDYYFTLSNRSSIEYIGNSKGTYYLSPALDKEKIAQDLNKELKEKGITDTSVKTDEKGVTLSLENIQFQANSFQLSESEKEKLKKIAELIQKVPDRDVFITGHTARVGYEETSQILSKKRSKAVGDFLISLKILKNRQILTVGKGSTVPIGDNNTEEGRRQNRRVEITILEN
ncbi:MAG: OmpA family protein [Leptospiraceae bacterium]|nr:OmpA family protein [Leptospiraceae bacterium]